MEAADMDPSDSPKFARTLGELVEAAATIRNRWWERYTTAALGDSELAERWDETRQFWKPWFRGHEEASWQLKPKLYRGGEPDVSKLF
jgi:hypothetical protein